MNVSILRRPALWLGGLFAALGFTGPTSPVEAQQITLAPIEFAFNADLPGDPFDFVANDVRAQIRQPDGKIVSWPAFFDGGTTWRVRHTPGAAGTYRIVSATRNGQNLNTGAALPAFTVQGAPKWVRIDARNPRRFVRGDEPYFPLGHNQGWKSGGLPDIPEQFGKMGAQGENWSRVWMNNWDGKNLDWHNDNTKPGPFGTFDLKVARRWDTIVGSAQKNGIAFQLVFQHHGQYSTHVNPQWAGNPYNVVNGGFLNAPDEFFTNAQAKELTKRKLRYAVARWGFSPAIMAWELFNEVQFTDPAREGKYETITAWHREMAAFLREQDGYDHLVTTSSGASIPASIWEAMDFTQEHTYPGDVIIALGAKPQDAAFPATKPYFIGEFGPSGVQDPTGVALHAGIWAGMMSGDAGVPAFWTWDDVEKSNLYFHFGAASKFVAASELPRRSNLSRSVPAIATAQNGDLSFGPGGGWGPVTQNEFTVTSVGAPEGIGALPPYLQGQANRNLGPEPLRFRVSLAQPGRFTVRFAQISKGGADVKLSANGQSVERAFPESDKDYAPQNDAASLSVELPAGQHVVTLANSGGDWAQIQKFTLSNYAPLLGAYALSNADYVAAWIYHRENVMAAPDKAVSSAVGTLTLTGLKAGRYRATWWDTRAGKAIGNAEFSVAQNTPAPQLNTPPVERDIALFVAPSPA